jgi:hypothetical protein
MSEPSQHGHAAHSSRGVDEKEQFDKWLIRVVIFAAVVAYLSHGLGI